MEQVLINLLSESTERLDEGTLSKLRALEKELDSNDDDKYATLLDIEMRFFKLGLKAGMELLKFCAE